MRKSQKAAEEDGNACVRDEFATSSRQADRAGGGRFELCPFVVQCWNGHKSGRDFAGTQPRPTRHKLVVRMRFSMLLCNH